MPRIFYGLVSTMAVVVLGLTPSTQAMITLSWDDDLDTQQPNGRYHLDGDLTYLRWDSFEDQRPLIRHLTLTTPSLPHDNLAALADLPQLQSLTLKYAELTVSAILPPLPQVTSLYLHHCFLPYEQRLEGMMLDFQMLAPNLRSFVCSGMGIDPGHIKLPATLNNLALRKNKVLSTEALEAALQELAHQVPNLEHLDLTDTNMTHLEILKDFSALRELNVTHTLVTQLDPLFNHLPELVYIDGPGQPIPLTLLRV